MEISPASEMEPFAKQLGPGRRRKTLAHFSSLRARHAVCQRCRSAFFSTRARPLPLYVVLLAYHIRM
jgi:hypothetical protein